MVPQPVPQPDSGATPRVLRRELPPGPARERVVQIADRPRGAQPEARRAPAPGAVPSLLMWCLPLFLLAAILLGMLVVRLAPQALFGWSFGLLVAAGLGWVIVSTFFPAKADRACPECGQKGLRRLDPRSTTGLLCGRCGWRDESASCFLLAESEGPLETIVLAQRGQQGPADE